MVMTRGQSIKRFAQSAHSAPRFVSKMSLHTLAIAVVHGSMAMCQERVSMWRRIENNSSSNSVGASLAVSVFVCGVCRVIRLSCSPR
eukprot:5397775-Amphidinium_carterae.1